MNRCDKEPEEIHYDMGFDAAIDRVLEIIDGCKFKYKEDEVAAWDGILWHNRALEQAKQAVLALKGGE